MRLYRICPEQYLENYTGLGGSYRDGARWNEPGIPVLYFARTPSVALLEMANYLPSPRLVPRSYRLGIYEFPEDALVEQLTLDALPEEWPQFPYPAATQKMGTQWLRQARSALLLVPSCAVPAGMEQLAVVNPAHPDSQRLKLIDATAVLYNRRVFTGL